MNDAIVDNYAQFAESLYDLMSQVARFDFPDIEPIGWDGQSVECQMQWVKLAKDGPDILNKNEGAPIIDVAEQLYMHFAAPEQKLLAEEAWKNSNAAYKIAWEAVVRHIACCMDADDGDSAQSVALMVDWARKKYNKLKEMA